MRVLAILCLACVLIPFASLATASSPEEIVRRIPVPAEPPHQGEVRLLRRNDALVVQTILDSKVLRHVLAAIEKKEQREWPEERKGWLDSLRYREALFQVYTAVRERSAQKQDRDDRRLQLMIEFVLEENDGYITFYAPILARDNGLHIEGKTLLQRLEASREYIYDNQLAILRDSFQLEPAAARQLLQPIPGGL